MKKNKIVYCSTGAGANNFDIEMGLQKLFEIFPEYKNQIKVLKSNKMKSETIRNMKNFDVVNENVSKVYQVNKEILNQGDFPILIGGDHSIAMGSVAAASSRYENLGVIWIDAHGDMNTNITSLTGNMHGMVISTLVGLGDDELVNKIKNKINPKNIAFFGIRDLDDLEEKLIIDHRMLVYKHKDMIEKGVKYNTLKMIENLNQKVSTIHISLDLDSLDPKIIPGVSVPVKNGFNEDEIFLILKQLFNKFDVVSFDVVEYNPIKDINNKTLDFLMKVVEYVKELNS